MPLWGFLFGWTSLLAIQAGANAYLGVAFGEYLGAFMPFFSSTRVIASIPVGASRWEPNTVQLAGVSAIAVLSAVNYFGTKQGARVQGTLTAIKLLSVAGMIGFGLRASARVSPDWTAPLPAGNLFAAMGLAIVAVLGNFDGWYQATLSAGEIKRPERNLPLGMIGGTVLIGAVYLLLNLVYFRALPLSEVGASDRIGEKATTALLGPTAGRLLAAVLVSVFGCLSSAIIGASRLGLPMSEDAPAFRWMARIHPRYQTPTAAWCYAIETQAVRSLHFVHCGPHQSSRFCRRRGDILETVLVALETWRVMSRFASERPRLRGIDCSARERREATIPSRVSSPQPFSAARPRIGASSQARGASQKAQRAGNACLPLRA